MQTVAIVDYGSGNLRSAAKAFEREAATAGNAAIVVTDDADRVRTADRIVLPGVGAFADCRAGVLALPGMAEALEEAVIARARPFLGICVGMQLMATRGREHGDHPGFDWIAGSVEAIYSALALKNQIAPPTLNLDNPSPGCDIDLVPHTAKERPIRYVLSNSFGFGGTNASLVFGRAP